MFCRLEPNGKSTPIYIGQAKSFKDRLPNHEQWAPAARLGATTVHAALVPSQDARDQYERELIHEFQPSLNKHHLGGLGLLGLGANQLMPSNGLLRSGISGRAR